jgi:hypothetical protein
MKRVWWMLLLLGCSPKSGQNCAMTAHDARPRVTITWHLKHGSMDDDPPRANVKLMFAGAINQTVELGMMFGQCKLAEVGALPDQPAGGSRVTELECPHGVKTEYATVLFLEPGKIVVRRSERVNDDLKPARDIQIVETPTCATFTSELAQGGEL